MKTFQTLLLREWMQHGRAWLIFCAAPALIALVALAFGSVHGDIPRDLHQEYPRIFLGIFGAYTLLMGFIVWAIQGLQAAGLARRDVQDRSIEFWRALPVSDVQSVGATVLTHLVLMPLLVTLVASVFGLILAPLGLLRVFGPQALTQLPWGTLTGVVIWAVPRLMFGVIMAAVWAAPIYLALMAASAWLKRWGANVLLAAVGVGGLILQQFYGLPQVINTIEGFMKNFAQALVPGAAMVGSDERPVEVWAQVMNDTSAWFLHDMSLQLQALVSPLFLIALVISAASFALLVLRRQRG